MAIAEEENPLDVFARRFRWIGRILASDAPGFVFFGGAV